LKYVYPRECPKVSLIEIFLEIDLRKTTQNLNLNPSISSPKHTNYLSLSLPLTITCLREEDAAALVVQRMHFQKKKVQSLASYTHRMPLNLATL
jgi:hypothetical protein